MGSGRIRSESRNTEGILSYHARLFVSGLIIGAMLGNLPESSEARKRVFIASLLVAFVWISFLRGVNGRY